MRVFLILLATGFLLVGCNEKEEQEINKSLIIAEDHNAGFYSDSCMRSGDLILRIPGGTKLTATKESFVFGGGMIGFPMYFVEYEGKSGWISSQSIIGGPKPTIDKSKHGKCHKSIPK